MPRRPRIKLAEIPQHLVQRGVNRAPCFLAEEDYNCYLHWLQKAAIDWGCAIHAYVLMTKHVHLHMQVVAEIKLADQTVMDYLLSPISKAFHEAGRER